jgi:hypothetical protein
MYPVTDWSGYGPTIGFSFSGYYRRSGKHLEITWQSPEPLIFPSSFKMEQFELDSLVIQVRTRSETTLESVKPYLFVRVPVKGWTDNVVVNSIKTFEITFSDRTVKLYKAYEVKLENNEYIIMSPSGGTICRFPMQNIIKIETLEY